MDLTQKHCVPCEGGFPAMTLAQAKDMMDNVPGWELNEEGTVIERTFRFKDFAEALAFANKVGALAEEEGHHPDMLVAWGRVRLTLTTHAVKGLSENDFVLAAKINTLT